MLPSVFLAYWGDCLVSGEAAAEGEETEMTLTSLLRMFVKTQEEERLFIWTRRV